MNVIVWQSYGTVAVYKADTAGQLNVVISNIQTATALWGIDEEFEAMVAAARRFVDTNRPDRARRELVAFVQRNCRGTDAFALFETTQVQ